MRWLPELAGRRVLRSVDAELGDTVPAERAITVEDLLTYRMGYGLLVEPTINPKVPVTVAAERAGLVMNEPDPRTKLGADEWIREFGELPLMYQPGERWVYNASGPDVWGSEPVFPSGSAGLVSTVDDQWAFARMMRDGGAGILSPASVAAMTRNHLTPEQITGGGIFLDGRGWGYGLSVTVTPDEVSDVPGRYGWEGGSGTSWFNDPSTGTTAILLTQVSDVLFDGTLNEFGRAAIHI